VALMSDRSSAPVRTFSIGFDDGDYDELAHARKVAAHFGTDHTEFVVRADALEVLTAAGGALRRAVRGRVRDPDLAPVEAGARARHGVLTGDGGDESFAGYDRHVANQFAGRSPRCDRCSAAGRSAGRWTCCPTAPRRRGALGASSGSSSSWARAPRRNAAWLAHFDLDAKHQLYSTAFRQWAGARDAEEMLYARYREADADNFTDATLYADITTYLPDTLLVKLDTDGPWRTGSRPARPFLDHSFMEFAARLPVDMKLDGRNTKVALKRALRGVLPADVLRRRKMGFNPPVDRWLRRELKELSTTCCCRCARAVAATSSRTSWSGCCASTPGHAQLAPADLEPDDARVLAAHVRGRACRRDAAPSLS
jgi:asparagine synthase (glutamine-hydrolysing)